MLTEDQVVLATCEWLCVQGWKIESRRLGTSKRDDIVAGCSTGERLAIECKGATSPKTDDIFSGHYAWQATSGAIFNCLRAIENNRNYQMIAIAIPNTELYQNLLVGMRPFCIRNKLFVFWVESYGVSTVWQPGNRFKPTPFR